MTAARDRTHEPKAHGAYMTIDPRVIPALVKHVRPRGTILECACGKMDMARALRGLGYLVVGMDLVDHGHGEAFTLGDFLQLKVLPEGVKAIITNPPNQLNRQFVEHALKLLAPVNGVLAVYQRNDWNTGMRVAPLFDHPAYAMKITCRFRPRWIKREDEPPPKPGEKRKSKSPFHRWSWFVWDHLHCTGPAVEVFS